MRKEENNYKLQLILLGTGSAMVIHCYNTCFVIRNGDMFFLTDAGGGNGILSRFEQAGIPVENLHDMFVTHGHSDHVTGTLWVIRKISSLIEKKEYKGNFTIYCHEEVKDIILTFCTLTLSRKILKLIGDRIHFHVLSDGEQLSIAGMEVDFFDIGSAKRRQFGYHLILPDKQRLVCLGDEPYHGIHKDFIENCDWLLAEAFCLERENEIFQPYEKSHSTVKDAARIAEELGAGNLVLYHTEDTNILQRKLLYTAEAKEEFTGKVFVPDDLEVIDL